ncbi:MAG: heme o synthase [Salaquimonas sp.]
MTSLSNPVANDLQNESELAVSTAMPADYFELLKPGVMRLVVFTAIAGLVIAPGAINPIIAIIAILCIAIGAGASGALNMWYDADIDAVMTRTAKRPIPDGRVTREEALAFGLVLSFFSVFTLGIVVNWLSAGILAFTIFFYAVVYSMWLKRSTPQNIVIGGAAGAFPPMIGWAVVTNSITIESIVLFAIIFIWTPPHFWALALFKAKDYGAVGIPMMPNVRGNRYTQNQILGYSILLAPIGFLPYLMGFAGTSYGVVSATLGALFIWFAFKCWQMNSEDVKMVEAKRLFAFSILYLFALFGVLILEVALPSILKFVA